MALVENKVETVPILLNSTHHVEGSKSTYRYQFPSGGVGFRHGDTASLVALNMYYSWFNISGALYGNNQITVNYGASALNITFPDGIYDIDDIDNYIQFKLHENGWYIIDGNNNDSPIYHIKFTNNSVQYRSQMDLFVIPVTPGAGETFPGGVAIPGGGLTPVITFNEAFGKLLGFAAGTYPTVPQATNFSSLGTLTPQINPVQSLLVRSNILSNGKYSNPTDLLAIFTITNGAKAGGVVTYEPNDYSYITLRHGHFEYIEISFVDQLFRPIKLEDTDLTIMILLKIIV